MTEKREGGGLRGPLRCMEESAMHVVVVDDSARFVWHVYQHLSRRLGMRIRDVPRRDSAVVSVFFASPDEPQPITTDDGVFHIWWVPTYHHEWKKMLRGVLEKAGEEIGARPPVAIGEQAGDVLLSVLLDVTTPAGVDRAAHYTIEQAYGICRDHIPTLLHAYTEVLPVSSYSRTFEALDDPPHERWRSEVTAKSIGAFNGLRRKGRRQVGDAAVKNVSGKLLAGLVPGRPEGNASVQRQEFHILVTGAGFELNSSATTTKVFGAERPDLRTRAGIHPTPEVLAEALDRTLKRVADSLGADISAEDLKHLRETHIGLDVNRGIDDDVDALLGRLHTMAEGLLLSLGIQSTAERANELVRGRERAARLVDEQEEYRRSITGAGQLDATSHMRFTLEMEFRRAFREILLQDDFGHMIQSVLTARLPWASWLTTNYTRYADRAIDATRSFADAPRWNVISTPHEARSLMEKSPGVRTTMGRQESILFKLHGDISHVNTMAIAGSDKRLISPHAIRVDSISQLYNAAGVHLRRLVDRAEPVHLIWHVLGHGMNDSMLLDSMVRFTVEELARDERASATFVVVNGRRAPGSGWGASKAAVDRIRGAVAARIQFYDERLRRILTDGKLTTNQDRVDFKPVELSAAEYVERVWMTHESWLDHERSECNECGDGLRPCRKHEAPIGGWDAKKAFLFTRLLGERWDE